MQETITGSWKWEGSRCVLVQYDPKARKHIALCRALADPPERRYQVEDAVLQIEDGERQPPTQKADVQKVVIRKPAGEDSKVKQRTAPPAKVAPLDGAQIPEDVKADEEMDGHATAEECKEAEDTGDAASFGGQTTAAVAAPTPVTFKTIVEGAAKAPKPRKPAWATALRPLVATKELNEDKKAEANKMPDDGEMTIDL